MLEYQVGGGWLLRGVVEGGVAKVRQKLKFRLPEYVNVQFGQSTEIVIVN